MGIRGRSYEYLYRYGRWATMGIHPPVIVVGLLRLCRLDWLSESDAQLDK